MSKSRCPKCGFSYAWNGSSCGHCRFHGSLTTGRGFDPPSELVVGTKTSVERFDLERAYRMALFSDAAYHDQRALNSGQLEVDHLEKVEFDPFADDGPVGVSALIAWSKDDLILAFRGTVMEVKNWNQLLLKAANWLVNFAFQQVPHTRHGWRIHQGFGYVVGHVWEQINDAVRTRLRHGQRLWVTGHSMGGALANLIANEFCSEGRVPVAGTYTFGAPRVGDAAFAELCLAPHYRVENQHDLVPHIPPPPSLAGIGKLILDKPLDEIEELVNRGVELASRLDPAFAQDLSTFLRNFIGMIRGVTNIEYKHAGSLKYFDPEGDLIDFDEKLALPEIVTEFIDESDLRNIAKFSCDLYRFVAFVGQLIEDLQSFKFSFLTDHKMSNYLDSIRSHMNR